MEREPLWNESEWAVIADAIRQCIERNEALAYITLSRVLDQNKGVFESAQRCDFNAEALSRFVDVEETLAAESDPRHLINPALSWLKDRAQNAAIGMNRATFRVQLNAPRGEKKLATLRFTLAYEEVKTTGGDEDTAPTLAEIYRSMRSLAEAYSSFNTWQIGCTQRLTGMFWDVQAFYEKVIRAASGENVSLRAEMAKFIQAHHQQTEELHGQLLAIKVEVARVQIEGQNAQVADARSLELEKARLAMGEKLGGNVLDGLADLGKTWLAAKFQVDPRLMGFLKLASADEELMNLVQHPEVSRHFAGEGAGAAAVGIIKEILRTPPLLAALVNPRLPVALARTDVKQALLASLQNLILAVEEQEKEEREAREAKEQAARAAAAPAAEGPPPAQPS